MTILDEIKTMKQQGISEGEISQELQRRGIPQQEISNALSQTEIKDAISAPSGPEMMSEQAEFQQPQEQQPPMQDFQQQPPMQDFQQQPPMQDMQPSMLNQQPPIPETPEQLMPQQYQQEYAYPQDNYDPYSQASYSQPSSISSDTIAEISEQIVSEKLSKIRRQLEKTIDLKTTTETKLTHLDERLQRIEKIIDRLQLSILQKVGEYLTNTSDLKKEIIETQKSIKKVSPKHHHTPTHKTHTKHKK